MAAGYSRVRHYVGGMADWVEAGAPVATLNANGGGGGAAGRGSVGLGARARALPGHDHATARRRVWSDRIVDAIGARSTGDLLVAWVGMILGFGVLYWVSAAAGGGALATGGEPIQADASGLVTSAYFSFVTALSIGYGDVVPLGAARILAVIEGFGGLLLFGCVISKLVSKRQEDLAEETHRISFENQLDRVRTNLHLVLGDLQAIGELCADERVRPEAVAARMESAAAVFAGELRTIHDLLYRPFAMPDEEVLETILANLSACLRELNEVLQCASARHRDSEVLAAHLSRVSALAGEICGECVPREYAPHLRTWMDRIQEMSRRIA